MDEKQQFLAFLKIAKRKLGVKQWNRNIHLGLFALGLAMILFVMLARFVVITHLVDKLIILTVLVTLGVVMVTFWKRPTNQQAARYFDGYIPENHVTTALHYLEDSSLMTQLQRRNTVSLMKNAVTKIQSEKTKLFYWKPFAAFILLFAMTAALFFLPNDTMKLATKQEKEEELVKEAKEDIEKLAKEDQTDKLKDLAEDTKEIKESNELLEELLKKEATLEKEKQTAEENKMKLKELAKNTKGLEEIANALEKSDSNKLKDALDKLLEKQLASLSPEEQESLENLLSGILNQETPNLSELTDEQLAEMMAALEDELTKLMESINSLDELLALQQQLQNLATSLQQGMVNNGLSESNSLAFGDPNQSGQKNQNGNPSDSGQNGDNNGQGENPSQGNGNNNSGDGNGNGNGNGTGNGNGNGTGSGSGGNGSGSGGSGAGFGQGSRELTIPEVLEGKDNTENDFGEFGEGNSEFQTTPDGLVLKGSVRSYEEVYGNYADSYRKSVERLELPTYLEDVVKDYFSDLDPGGE